MKTLTNKYPDVLPLWSATELSFSPIYLLGDASALSKHLDHCKVVNKKLFAMRCGVDLLHSFVLRRFVTTVVVAFILIGSYSLVV